MEQRVEALEAVRHSSAGTGTDTLSICHQAEWKRSPEIACWLLLPLLLKSCFRLVAKASRLWIQRALTQSELLLQMQMQTSQMQQKRCSKQVQANQAQSDQQTQKALTASHRANRQVIHQRKLCATRALLVAARTARNRIAGHSADTAHTAATNTASSQRQRQRQNLSS